jgi:hypothetical protein
MFKFVLLTIIAATLATAEKSQALSAYVKIQGPITKQVRVKIISAFFKANTHLKDYDVKSSWIPSILSLPFSTKNLSDREILTQMRSLSIEAVNCPDQSTEWILPSEQTTEFLSKCYLSAINTNRWNRVNFGAWEDYAKLENKINIFSYGNVVAFENLKPSELNSIKEIVATIKGELAISNVRIPTTIEILSN